MENNARGQENLKDIDGLIQVYSEELSTDKEQFDIIKEEQITFVSNWRQYILAAVTFAAPLIVSLGGTEPIKSHLIPILEFIIAFGLASFILLTAIRSSASTVLRKIDKEYLKLISSLYYMRGYLAGMALHRNYDSQLIEFLSVYVTIVYGNRVGLWYAFSRASKSLPLWRIRDTLTQTALLQIEIIYAASKGLRTLQIRLPENDRLLNLTKSIQIISESLVNMAGEFNKNSKEFLRQLESMVLDANSRTMQ